MFPEFFMDNHGLLFFVLFCKAIVLCVFLGTCYFMGNQYLKEIRNRNPQFIKPKKKNKCKRNPEGCDVCSCKKSKKNKK